MPDLREPLPTGRKGTSKRKPSADQWRKHRRKAQASNHRIRPHTPRLPGHAASGGAAVLSHVMFCYEDPAGCQGTGVEIKRGS